MKALLTVFALGFGFTCSASPLLVRETNDGTYSLASRKSSRCEIHLDKMVISNSFGGAVTEVTLPLRLSTQVTELAEKAAAGKVKPIAARPTYSAGSILYKVRAGAEGDTMVVLKNTSAIGSENDSPAAAPLVHLLDMNCR